MLVRLFDAASPTPTRARTRPAMLIGKARKLRQGMAIEKASPTPPRANPMRPTTLIFLGPSSALDMMHPLDVGGLLGAGRGVPRIPPPPAFGDARDISWN